MSEQACRSTPTRTAFAPYFKARWQNMQNIINDTVFYDAVPEPYKTYYNAYIRQWLDWSRGYVPALHKGDFFSTGMGYTVCEIFSRECLSGGYRFTGNNPNHRAFVQDWASANRLTEKLRNMFFNQAGGGNVLLCLTPIDRELYLSVYPINRVIFSINRREKITMAVIFNRFTSGKHSYIAKEWRTLDGGRGYYKVDLLSGGNATASENLSAAPLGEIPREIMPQWSYTYGGIKNGMWYEMPRALNGIGLYNVKNKACASAFTDLPGYSDSSLHTALDVLYSIDYNFTQQQLDQYWGRTRVVTPKEFTPVKIDSNADIRRRIVEGTSYVEAVQSPPLDDDLFTSMPGANNLNGDPLKPFFMQPDLRGEPHKYIRDADLELLASKVGLSSSTLANHLSYNHSKTATEVHSEQDTTEVSVNDKRDLASVPLDEMLADVSVFYGFASEIKTTWNRAGVNSVSENQFLLDEFREGALSYEDYLKKRWRDLDESEIAKKVLDYEVRQKRQQQYDSMGAFPLDDVNYFGGVTNDTPRTEQSGVDDRERANKDTPNSPVGIPARQKH